MKARKIVMVVIAVALVGVLFLSNGCKKAGKGGGTAYADTVDLCVKCGQVAGGEKCCKPDQTKCSACSLTKGSPGCCNIPKDATSAAVCGKCGQIAGGEKCCKPGQTKCSGCGLTKGSPGCCKLPKTE